MGLKLLIGGSPCTHWRPVPGYTGLYEVSEDGRVRNARTKRVLSRKTERNGYVRVHLSKDGCSKSVLLHRVVAAAFVPNPDGLPTVNHIDEDKANNAASNLEWSGMSYQNSYGRGAVNRNKAKERPVWQLSMDGDPVRLWGSIKEASAFLGVNPSTVVCVCKGKRRYKSTGGYKFKYAEEVVLHG